MKQCKCSKCKTSYGCMDTPYCPNCGRKMVGIIKGKKVWNGNFKKRKRECISHIGFQRKQSESHTKDTIDCSIFGDIHFVNGEYINIPNSYNNICEATKVLTEEWNRWQWTEDLLVRLEVKIMELAVHMENNKTGEKRIKKSKWSWCIRP